jgi:diacylglycerol kinase family enzyme
MTGSGRLRSRQDEQAQTAVLGADDLFGEHLRLKQVEYFKTGLIMIDTECKLDLYADGEYAGQTPVQIGLIPQGLRVIVPG